MVLRMHYGLEHDGKFKNQWICPEAANFPDTVLSLRKEKTRGHGLVEYSWDHPTDSERSIRDIVFDTKTMQLGKG